MAKRLPRKEDYVPAVTRSELDDAVQRYLSAGGEITKLPDAPEVKLNFNKDRGFIMNDGVVNVDWSVSKSND